MPHLSQVARLRIIKIYQTLLNSRHGNKAKQTQKIALEHFNIKISLVGIYNILHKWKITGGVKDLDRSNLLKQFISDLGLLAINKALLKNSFITC